jgi:chromobox protein 1
MKEYFKKIGGRPEKKEKKSRKRKTEQVETPKSGAKPNGRKKLKSDTPESTTRTTKKSSEWKPPSGSWENHILNIDTIEELADATTGDLVRHGYVVWKDGTKSRHALATLNTQAPQKVSPFTSTHSTNPLLTYIELDVTVLRVTSVRSSLFHFLAFLN